MAKTPTPHADALNRTMKDLAAMSGKVKDLFIRTGATDKALADLTTRMEAAEKLPLDLAPLDQVEQDLKEMK